MKFSRIPDASTGKVCRSPVAEALFRAFQPQITIGLAGLGARAGEGVDLPVPVNILVFYEDVC